MYRTAKVGQQVWLLTERGIKPVTFVAYVKTRKTLVNPDMATVQFEPDGLGVNVEIKNIFKEDPYA